MNNDSSNADLPVKDFLSRHVPDQVTNSRRLCYRHRPDLIKRRQPDALDIEKAQRVNILYSMDIIVWI